MSNVTPLKQTYMVRLRPLEKHVLQALVDAHGAEPIDTYSTLLMAAAHAANLINMPAGEVEKHLRLALQQSARAIAARPDIFGGEANDR